MLLTKKDFFGLRDMSAQNIEYCGNDEVYFEPEK